MGKPALVKYTIDDIDVFFAPNSINLSSKESLEVFRQGVIQRYLKNSKHASIITAYAKKNNLEGIAVLSADCKIIRDKWLFSDSKNWYSIQSWIDNKDGKYAGLMIDSELGRKDVYSKKSMLILNSGLFSVIEQTKGEESLELYIPKVGLIDNYTIDSYIKESLKK